VIRSRLPSGTAHPLDQVGAIRLVSLFTLVNPKQDLFIGKTSGLYHSVYLGVKGKNPEEFYYQPTLVGLVEGFNSKIRRCFGIINLGEAWP